MIARSLDVPLTKIIKTKQNRKKVEIEISKEEKENREGS